MAGSEGRGNGRLILTKAGALGRVVGLGLAGLLTAMSWAGPMTDFAPLQIGNTWVYQGYSQSQFSTMPLSTYSQVTRLRIESSHTVGDTLLFRLKAVDTLIRTTPAAAKPDSVWIREYDIKERQGRIVGVARVQVPGQVTYPEMLVAEAFATHGYDSGLVKPRTVDSMRRMVAAESVFIPGFRQSTIKKAERIKDVGLQRLTIRTDHTGSSLLGSTYTAYSLVRFNGESFTPVSAKTQTGLRKQVAAPGGYPIQFLRELRLNALGRREAAAGRLP